VRFGSLDEALVFAGGEFRGPFEDAMITGLYACRIGSTGGFSGPCPLVRTDVDMESRCGELDGKSYLWYKCSRPLNSRNPLAPVPESNYVSYWICVSIV
jgi:hypothetical protein